MIYLRSVSHTTVVMLSTLAVATLSLCRAGLALSADAPQVQARPATESCRAPFQIAFTPDGERAVVTEFDEGAVAIVDRTTGKILQHVSTGGQQPTGVAVTASGGLAVVTNSLSGSVAFIDLKTFKTDTLALRGMPWDVVLSSDGRRGYVSLSQLDEVAVIDVASRKIVAMIPTGRRPRALAITPDGRTLVAANMTAGSVSFIDTATLTETAQGRTPAVNLRGVAVFPNGRQVFAVGQRAQNERPTETAIGIWSNQAFLQVPDGPPNGVQNLWLDLMGTDVADPDSVVLSPDRSRAFITCSGGNSVNVVPIRGNGDTQTVRNVGAGPRGLTFTPDFKELWVADQLGNDLAVLDPNTLKVVRRIDLGPTKRHDVDLLGRYLFNSASIAKGGQFSCNSCHPDGGMDGISWKFVHVHDALGKEIDRNVKGLRGHIATCGPFRWSGHDATLDQFIAEEIPGLLQGPKPTPREVKALAAYIESLPLPPNPYRSQDGSFTAAAMRGRALFEGKAECATCHSGQRAGGTRKAWIGTTPAGVELQVPRLDGVYDTDPYLHDGKARTLEEVFSQNNVKKLHGKAHDLSQTETNDLIRYVKEL